MPSHAGPPYGSRCAAILLLLCALYSHAAAQVPVVRDDVTPVETQPAATNLSADFGGELRVNGTNGIVERVGILRGHVRITQADTRITADQAVAWIIQSADKPTYQVMLYLEGNIRVTRPGQTRSYAVLQLDLKETRLVPELTLRHRSRQRQLDQDPLFRRALARRQQRPETRVSGVAYQPPLLESTTAPDQNVIPSPENLRRLQLYPRTRVPFNVTTEKSPGRTPPENVLVITGGINLIIDVVEKNRRNALFGSGPVDLSADRMVIWTQLNDDQQLTTQLEQSAQAPLEVYLEGNIVIRQGLHVLRARRAIFDGREKRALVLDAHLEARLPDSRIPLRVRAERIRQNGPKSFHAQNAWATTSPYGKPGFRLQASDIFLEQRLMPGWLNSPVAPASTGQPISWITTQNNVFLVEDLPLFYAPNLAGPASELNVPLSRVNVKQDNVFGVQLETSWNLFRLLSLDPIEGVDWSLNADYYTDRGPRIGLGTLYNRGGLLGLPGTARGDGDGAFIYDEGFDNLGRDRRRLAPESPERGRLRWSHRHELSERLTLLGEAGYLSDRNVLEQYYEEEFDEDKDQETLLYLEQRGDATAWSLLARPQLNSFEATTEWLPRGDLYLFSEPLLGSLLSWSSHTSAGYGRLKPADTPLDPAEVFDPLPYTSTVGGAVLMARNELALPLALGPAPVVPYVMAESSYWSEGFAGSEIDRHLFSGGVRSSLSLWRAYPEFYSAILGLNGLAHKMTFETDAAWTETSRGLDEIPLYNEIDDDAQERFRYRFLANSFGGTLPLGFDPRSVAVRQGTGLGIASPWHELVADQQAVRMAWRQRLQTKVGPAGQQRTRNWMTLDLEGTWFPRAERDNFGEELGLLTGTYRWHVSDRTTLLADGYLDLFENAPELWNIGVLSQRTTRGSLYAGLREVRGGGLDSRMLTAAFSYRMSPKWATMVATAYDLSEQRNQGQSLTITRIGADFLVHIGGSYDESRGTAGFHFSLEPRFGPLDAANPQLASLLGLGSR